MKKLDDLNESFDEFMAEDNVDTYATQRVKLTDMPQERPAPRRRAPSTSAKQRPAAQQPVRKRKPAMTKKERNTVIALFSVAGVLLIGIIVALCFILSGPADNQLILNNVYVAGVNIGGMTQAQAKSALSDVAKDYEQLSMVVKVLDTEVSLTPAVTGAKLDIDAVVKAAYDLGRTGSKSEQDKAQNATSHNVSILPYLNLDMEYIQEAVDKIGEKYSTLRSDPKITVSGSSPLGQIVDTDTTKVYQTMTIFIGTAEYDLSTDALYQQIKDAYDSGIFEVVGKCTVTPPNLSVLSELEKAFKQYCQKPSNAEIDENFNVTAEVYGYGFVLETVKDQVSAAKYGETLEIPMTFVRPDITAEDLAGNLFKDILGSYVLDVQADNNLISNLKLVCKALNGLLLKSDESFSFNELIGETTRQRGYKPFSQFVDKVYTENYYGGGISQAASALYTCVLQADLDVLERHNHAYVPTFILPGMDADVRNGVKDLRFKNSTEYPIRIVAEYKNGKLHIQLLGTDTKDYTVELKFTTDKTYDPVTLLQTMPANNVGGYKNGDILQTPIAGCDVSVYKVCTPKPVEPELDENGNPIEPTEPSEPSAPTEPGETDPDESEPEPLEVFVGQSHYDKRNVVMVSIAVTPVPPTEPSEPSEPSEPTEPSESIEPTESITPSESTEPTNN